MEVYYYIKALNWYLLDPFDTKEKSSWQQTSPKQNKRDDTIFKDKDSENIDQKSVMVSQTIDEKTAEFDSYIANTVNIRDESEGEL